MSVFVLPEVHLREVSVERTEARRIGSLRHEVLGDLVHVSPVVLHDGGLRVAAEECRAVHTGPPRDVEDPDWSGVGNAKVVGRFLRDGNRDVRDPLDERGPERMATVPSDLQDRLSRPYGLCEAVDRGHGKSHELHHPAGVLGPSLD
jgi:hypothetical protein